MDEDGLSVEVIAIQLTRLQRMRDRTAAQLRSRDGVDPAAFAILFRLLCDGPMRSGALADAVHSDASTVSRHIAHLVERKLVERQADRNDGRATVLVVTERGREVAERIRRRRHENLTRVMAAWTPQDRATFAGLLRKFVDDYEQAKPAMIAAIRQDHNLYDLRTENDS
ncbi:MarR family winged helix-turn-helix transcriptional regulator [Nocardia pseudovaccinii]|uniref:MarR family winged helix-turn-helix transcriptional regulator n=1 Tax=Nocardia pseudovaccinii TaxID=189540 RepID=UPI0007A3E1FF|nr:MarR family transcriptional regulator [Nocardia pseudovaccinii]